VNAGYKHETFLFSIAHSVVLFLVVYSGDVLSTTARIQEECGRRGKSLLASSGLLGRLTLTDGCVVVPIGAIRLEGKAEALALSAVRTGGARALSA